MSRFARRKDRNHQRLVELFEAYGCSVLALDVSTPGAPDVLVGRNGADQLVEFKPDVTTTRERNPRKTQVEFAKRWKGRWVDVARNDNDVMRIANGLGAR